MRASTALFLSLVLLVGCDSDPEPARPDAPPSDGSADAHPGADDDAGGNDGEGGDLACTHEGDVPADTGMRPTTCQIPCLDALTRDCRPAGTCRHYIVPLTWFFFCYSNGVTTSSGTNHGSRIVGRPDEFVYKADRSLCYTSENDGCNRRLYRNAMGQVVATVLLRDDDQELAVLCGDQRYDAWSMPACLVGAVEGACAEDPTCSPPPPSTTGAQPPVFPGSP
jgi:hypothetical protein